MTPYGLILYPLRNKQAVVAADGAEGGVRRTPADSPIKTFAHFALTGRLTEFGALDATLEFTAQGDRDWPMRAGYRRVSQARWEDLTKAVSTQWGLPGDVDACAGRSHRGYVEAVSSEVSPAHQPLFRGAVGERGFPRHPAARGSARARIGKSTEPIDIGPAGEADYKVQLEFPANYSVHTPLPVKISRDYGEYSSSYKFTVSKSKQGVLEGERKLNVKVNELPAARRADYESFRNVTLGDTDQLLSTTILAPSGSATDAAAKMEGTPTELHTAGVKALESKDYRGAIDLLKARCGRRRKLERCLV